MICCTPKLENELSIEDVQGHWIGGTGSGLQVLITPDSLYWSLNDKLTIEQNYEYKIIGDSVFLVSEDGIIDKLLLLPEKDKIVCCNFKSHIDSSRIDEVIALYEMNDIQNFSEKQSQNNDLKKDIIIVPENQIGIFLIAFSKEEGSEAVYDKDGNRVFTFEIGSSILYSQAKEDIRKLALNQYEVFQQTESGKLKPYPLLSKQELKEELTETGLVAIIEGFNQGPRENLNRLVDKEISGNVLWLNIGSEASISNTYDSLFYNDQYYKMDYKGRWIQ